MTAGKGIVHSEKVSPELLASGQKLHGLQTWVALPIEHEETAPRFEHYSADNIPVLEQQDVKITVVIGTAYGKTSPVQAASETLYVEIKLELGASIKLPEAEELGVYVVAGNIELDGQAVSEGVLAVLKNGASASVSAPGGAHLMICGGDTLEGERIVWWNFVNSSRERLEQAKRDWKEGKFDDVPGESEFIPLPEKVKT